jgi:DNA-binding response OmpR family regulator
MPSMARSEHADTWHVEIVPWPAGQRHRAALARAGVPRLLLLGPDDDPPGDLGVDEDWLRSPVTDSDVRSRAERLGRTIAALARDEPFIDRFRILHRGSITVPLTRIEAVLLGVLLASRGDLVPIEALELAAWGGAAPSRDAIHAAMSRLRRRLQGAMLVVRSVRRSGFVLERDPV